MFPRSSNLRLFSLVLAMLGALPAHADDFERQLDLAPLDTLSIQHQQTLKTLDSYARQTVAAITGNSSVDGKPALYTVLDMTFVPETYVNANVVKIKNAPLRKDFQLHATLSQAEKDRILKEGTVSLAMLQMPETQKLFGDLQNGAMFKVEAIGQVIGAANALAHLGEPGMPELAVVAPATANVDDAKWHDFAELSGTVPAWVEVLKSNGGTPPPALAGYDAYSEPLSQAGMAMLRLGAAWRSRDAAGANAQVRALADVLPRINSGIYPAPWKRSLEVIYNRLYKLTIPGAMLYFAAFVLFLMAARSGVASLRLWGLRVMLVAVIVHTAGIAIRWLLVEKSVGNWFEAIPIKNQFESVLFSAWFGATVGMILEMRKGKSMFGAAASFVGWLALVALFTVPYFIRDIGGEIGQVNGVLMSYWLYIHVTLVTASYALIGMGFCLSIWWLVKYYASPRTRYLKNPRQLSADSTRDDLAAGSFGGGAMSVGFVHTLARIFFVPAPAIRSSAASKPAALSIAGTDVDDSSFLARLDQCNLVILQLAFWVLGTGIICGAIWADMSWGRPWGWDPKETFALVTWIVYLIVVHVRVATVDKAWWTAMLSIVGFFIMLFNWIGVNFFLVGLHSYA